MNRTWDALDILLFTSAKWNQSELKDSRRDDGAKEKDTLHSAASFGSLDICCDGENIHQKAFLSELPSFSCLVRGI